jgi:hypothetical protein
MDLVRLLICIGIEIMRSEPDCKCLFVCSGQKAFRRCHSGPCSRWWSRADYGLSVLLLYCLVVYITLHLKLSSVYNVNEKLFRVVMLG